MALYALDDVDDAYQATRTFLTSIGRRTWLKLAFVVFFIGGTSVNIPGGNVPTGGDAGTQLGTTPIDGIPTFDADPGFWLLVGGVVLVGVLIAVVLSFVGAVMEFVFVESLRTGAVSVREYWRQYWRQGARLFGFRLVIGLLVLAPIALGAVLVAGPAVFGSGGPAAPFLSLLVLVPVFFLLTIVVGLVNGFTTNFVVPVMILEECGVLAGWRRLWPTIRAQWKQYLAYAVLAWVLSLVIGIVASIVTVLLAFLLLVPFGILFALGFGVFTAVESVGIVLLAVTGILFGLAVLVVAALVQVPVQTYLRYYALLVLGDVEEAFDIVPDQRAAVRSADGEEP